MSSRKWLWISMVLTVLASFSAVALAHISNTTPTLGLDLQGGFSVVLQAREVNGQLPSVESVEKAKDIIRQRVDGLGVAEPEIVRQGRTVIVQLPGVTDRAKAEKVVGCTAKLEFRPVLSREANPDAPPLKNASTTTTKSTSKSTSTTKPKGSTTTTSSTGKGETGSGSMGLSAGEGAMPVQFAPPTTTTTAPPTTTTALPVTTTAATTTTAVGDTTTTTAAASGAAAGCKSGAAGSAGSTASTTAPLAPGSVVVPSKDGQVLYTLGPVGFTGDALTKAEASLGDSGWAVNVSVKNSKKTEANAAFNECFNGAPTCPVSGGDNTHGAIAIVLDGEVLSAPAVQGQDLASSNFTISGSFTPSEAKELALVLRYGSLPVEFDQVALQQVSATLGTDSLHAGLLAGAFGIALVAIYMLLYYRGLGLVVIAGLTVWGGFMYGLVCWLSANQGLALTLSGIIGIVVSVGTTVDSYVVYFERMRDEVRASSARSATDRGFHSAIRTIITADVASFIGAFLLWWLTVGPVRGFAFFLGMSVVLDLFVAYFFTRPVVALMSYNKRLTDSRFLGLDSARERAVDAEGAVA